MVNIHNGDEVEIQLDSNPVVEVSLQSVPQAETVSLAENPDAGPAEMGWGYIPVPGPRGEAGDKLWIGHGPPHPEMQGIGPNDDYIDVDSGDVYSYD